jgi:hypothetical protein
MLIADERRTHLSDRSREWQGEDTLHEMAFGEPVE